MSEQEHDDTESEKRPRPRGRRGARRLIILAVVLFAAVAIVAAQVWGGDGGGEETSEPTERVPTEMAGIAQNVPPPALCQVAPRSIAAMQALLATPVASPVASPVPNPAMSRPVTGTPADPATIAAITADYRESVACLNAGNFARAYALYTDDYLRRILAGASAQTGVDPALVAIVIATPAPSPPMTWTAILATGNAQFLPDGRASAVVVTVKVRDAADPNAARPRVVFFVNEDGRWLIDGVFNPAAEATPAATPAG